MTKSILEILAEKKEQEAKAAQERTQTEAVENEEEEVAEEVVEEENVRVEDEEVVDQPEKEEVIEPDQVIKDTPQITKDDINSKKQFKPKGRQPKKEESKVDTETPTKLDTSELPTFDADNFKPKTKAPTARPKSGSKPKYQIKKDGTTSTDTFHYLFMNKLNEDSKLQGLLDGKKIDMEQSEHIKDLFLEVLSEITEVSNLTLNDEYSFELRTRRGRPYHNSFGAMDYYDTKSTRSVMTREIDGGTRFYGILKDGDFYEAETEIDENGDRVFVFEDQQVKLTGNVFLSKKNKKKNK